MRRGRLPRTAILFLALALSGRATAQRESYSYISYAGSDVSLLSTASDEETARINTPVLGGDRVVTGPGSRAEIVLASGNIVRIDAKTEIRFDRMAHTYESNDERDLLYLVRGTVAVEVRDAASGDLAFRLDTDDSTVVMEGRGQLRVDAGRRGTEVWVGSGEAQVVGRGGSAVLGAGQSAAIRGTDPFEAETLDAPRDKFARFVDERSGRQSRPETQTYVGADYEYEAAVSGLEDNGLWVWASDQQRWCWRPTVTADWRPYWNGYWRWTPCGLTWVSYEPWGWLPYHYGSWYWDSLAGWVWAPDIWYSPAWVYWNYTPFWTGWCPTGYYGGKQHRRLDRKDFGPERRGMQVPNLNGRVEVSQIDQRGWNYASSARVGGRLDPARDVLRGDRVPFRTGEIGVISTAPLRIETGQAPASAAVRSAVQKISEAPVPKGSLPANEGLTAILRRDAILSPAGEQELRRSLVPLRARESLHSVPPETLLEPRLREADPARGEDWRTTLSRERVPAASKISATERQVPARDDGWRSPASSTPPDIAPRTAGPRGGDTGWRAPRPESRVRAAPPSARRTSEGDWRDATRRSASPRFETSSPGRGTPASKNEAYRPASPPPSAQRYSAPSPAPRVSNAPPAPRASAPAPAPRAAPAPQAAPPKMR